jgi:hypothetical protein
LRRRLLSTILAVAALVLSGCSDGAFAALNSPPGASILEPEHGAQLREGELIAFRGLVDDRLTSFEDLIVSWTSSLDGQLFEGPPGPDGVTSFQAGVLSSGSHEITLRVVDPRGVSGTDRVTISVLDNGAPSIEITEPIATAIYHSDAPVSFVVGVLDPEDPPTALRVSWTADGDELLTDLIPDDSGTSIASLSLEEGSHTLLATVSDQEGKNSSATVSIVVGGPNGLPTCSLDSPQEGSVFVQGDAATFVGAAEDPDVPSSALAVAWLSSADGPLGNSVPADSGTVAFSTSSLSGGLHTVTMIVVDEVGATCADSVDIRISSPPSVVVTSPVNGSTVGEGQFVVLEGYSVDLEDAEESLTVVWFSSLDGEVGPDNPDSAGFVSGGYVPNLLGTHLYSLVATDSEGLTGTGTSTLTVNGSPGAPIVSIGPAAPDTLDDLVAIIDVSASDPEADPLTYQWTWSVGGVPQSGLAGSATVPASTTTRGELWEVSVTATDGWSSGPSATASVTIGNAPPMVSIPSISPSVLYTSTSPSCASAVGTDPDGDPVTVTFDWTVNGQAAGSGGTLASTEIVKNDSVHCTATPSDGSLTGPSTASAPVTVSNSAPSAPAVALVPSLPTSNDSLTCQMTSFGVDPDDDPVTHTRSWTLNGVLSVHTGTYLSAVWTSDQDVVECSGTASDGAATSLPGTDSVIVCDQSTWYVDGDGDGFGDYASEVETCTPDPGWISVSGDCDDNDPTVYPTAGDTATDSIDSDCDGMDCEAGDLNGVYFVVCLDNGDWFDAELACTAAGYDGLASLTTAAEETHVVSLLVATGSANNNQPWLGFTDQSSPGTFAWTDGSALTYSNWATGQPDSGGTGSDCAVLDYSSGAADWDDVSCSQGSPGWTSFVCSTR